jgi:hypothetical protein
MSKVKLTKQQAQTLTRKLWELVTTTPGVGMLAEPLQRAEYSFERLSRPQKITVGVLATLFAEAVYAAIPQEIVKETSQEAKQEIVKETSQEVSQEVRQEASSEGPIQADEIIQASQDERDC